MIDENELYRDKTVEERINNVKNLNEKYNLDYLVSNEELETLY